MEDYKNHLDDAYSKLTTKQVMLLELLRQSPRTIGEIAESFQMTASAASQLIKKLENSHYVKREINLDNRREIIVSLGTEGESYVKKAEELDLYIIQKYYLKLGQKDLENLLDLYEKLYQIMIDTQE
ncbi:transcriptional regulator [Bacillus sp. M6-12]|nr:transcriptional regulator [Bacillus sp. M6-12]